jgi:hypothetical protein
MLAVQRAGLGALADEYGLGELRAEQKTSDARIIGDGSYDIAHPCRQFPFNLMLWDLDRRIRTGRPLV